MQKAGIWKICETEFAVTPMPANNESKSQLVYCAMREATLKVVQQPKQLRQKIVEMEHSTLSTKVTELEAVQLRPQAVLQDANSTKSVESPVTSQKDITPLCKPSFSSHLTKSWKRGDIMADRVHFS